MFSPKSSFVEAKLLTLADPKPDKWLLFPILYYLVWAEIDPLYFCDVSYVPAVTPEVISFLTVPEQPGQVS